MKAGKAKERIDPIGAMVDQIGVLERELAPFATKIKTLEALRKALRSVHNGFPEGEPITANGERFIAILGPCTEQRTVNIFRAFKALGTKQFCELVSLPVGRLESNVPPNVVIQLVDCAKSGPRPLTISQKA